MPLPALVLLRKVQMCIRDRYNIVDRMYIGHIPRDGAMALTGVGVCMPLIMVVSAFAALISNGGAPRATIFTVSYTHLDVYKRQQ